MNDTQDGGPSKELSTFKTRVLLARFLQNNALRLVMLYPTALHARSAALLVSFTAVLSSSLDLDSGFLTTEQVRIVNSALGGKFHGLLMGMLSTESSLQIAHQICSFQQPPARAPSSSHTRAERAASYGASLRQLETMASFPTSDSFEEEWPEVPIPQRQKASSGSSLQSSTTQKSTLQQSLRFSWPHSPCHDCHGRPTGLRSSHSALLHPQLSGPRQGERPGAEARFRARASHSLPAPLGRPPLPHCNSHGLCRPTFHGQYFCRPGEMHHWMSLQRFLLQLATHPHPVLADLALDSWELIATHSHPSLPERHVSLLFTLIRRASALNTVLEAGKAAGSGKGSGQGRKLSDMQKGATEEALSTAAGLTLLRLSRLTSVLLASCQPSSLRKLVPPFLRQAVATLKQSTAPTGACVMRGPHAPGASSSRLRRRSLPAQQRRLHHTPLLPGASRVSAPRL